MSPWDYYIAMRHKSWNELTEYEQERITLAAYLICQEIGTSTTIFEVENFLRIHLPEIPQFPPPRGGVLCGFIEWQSRKPGNDSQITPAIGNRLSNSVCEKSMVVTSKPFACMLLRTFRKVFSSHNTHKKHNNG